MNIKKIIVTAAIFVIPLIFSLPIGVSAAEADYSNLIVSSGEKPSVGGALKVLKMKNGMKTLCDKNGNPIQLRGMSTHGLQWFPGILNNNAFAALSKDWESNVIRIAMHPTENGYNVDPEGMKEKVIKGINLAIANDMYAIVDWHMSTPGDPNAAAYSGAKDFFKEISSKYHNNPNIIYEICNEPNVDVPGVSDDANGWVKIKAYAEPIIKMLRDNGNNNLIIVGTPTWSHRPDLAADNPITDTADNIAYTAHFSAGSNFPSAGDTDRTKVMSSIRYALEHGVAVFVSEWTPSEATGLIEHGGLYLDSSDNWVNFLNKNNISWCTWSLSNNNDASAAFTAYEMGKSEETSLDPGEDQVWSPYELSAAGEYDRARIKGIKYEPVTRKKEAPIVKAPLGKTVIPSNFEDLTRNGWDWDPNCAVNTSLSIEEANNSKAMSWYVKYPEKKPTDEWTASPRLTLTGVNAVRGDNNYFAFDFYLKPDNATKGTISFYLSFIPPSLGYWALASEQYNIPLANLSQMEKTPDGLYHFKVRFNLNKIDDGKVIKPDTVLSDITIVAYDKGCDFAGKMYIDNIEFEK